MISSSMFDKKFFPPKGTFYPKYYIIASYPSKSEVSLGGFTSPEYHILDALIRDAEINPEEVRFSYACPFHPKDESGNTRELTLDEIKTYSKYVLSDIEKLKPKHIICLGSTPAQLFDIFEKLKDSRSKEYKTSSNIPISVTYSMKYLQYRGGESSNEYKSSVGDFIKVRDYDIFKKKRENSDVEFETLSYSDAKKLPEIFKDDKMIVLDYEASGLNTMHKDFYIGGVGLYGMTSKKCVYVHLHSFETWDKVSEIESEVDNHRDDLKNFLENNNFIVYNIRYEYPCTRNYFNSELGSAVDLLQWGRCLSDYGSLKEVVSRRLGIPIWKDEVEDWADSIAEIVKSLLPTTSGNSRPEFDSICDDESLFKVQDSLYELMKLKLLKTIKTSHNNYISDKGLDSEIKIPMIKLKAGPFWESLRSNNPELFTYISETRIVDMLYDMFDNLCTDKSPHLMIDKNFKGLLDRRQYNLFRSVHKIESIISKFYKDQYSEFDFKLYEFIKYKVSNKDIDKNFCEIPVKLLAPYCAKDVYYTGQLYHSFYNELDEKGLLNAADIYNKQGLLSVELENNGIAWDEDKAKYLSDIYTESAIECGINLLTSDRMSRSLKLSEQDKLVIKSATSIEAIKQYFNPMSTHISVRESFSRALCTPRFILALMFYEVHKDLAYSDEYISEYPTLKPLYDEIMSIEESELHPNVAKSRSSCLQGIANNIKDLQNDIVSNSRSSSGTTKELQLFKKYSNYTLESMDSTAVEELYQTATNIIGIQVDKEDTWIEEFTLLYNFRKFKKVMKSMSSYIDGKMGRFSVSTVEKSSLRDQFSKRQQTYKETGGDLESDKVYLMNGTFSPSSAATKRWQSFVHTVPWGSELQDLRVSRYGDKGIRLHFDYSQMEVRVLAKASNDGELLKAFYDDADIHRRVAAKVWKKPEEDVTSGERRYAKMSCLKGDTKIKLMDGRTVTVESIYKRKETPQVYSFDINKKTINNGQCVEVQLTKHVKKLIKITFNNGKSIEVTHDHPILQPNGFYKEASSFKVGDLVETLYYRVPTGGAYGYRYEQVRDVRHTCRSGTRGGLVTRRLGKWVETHKLIQGEASKGYHIDHVDGNTFNNTRENIQVLKKVDNAQKSKLESDRFAFLPRVKLVFKYMIENELELTEVNYNLHRSKFHKRNPHWSTLITLFSVDDILNSLKVDEEFHEKLITENKLHDPVGFRQVVYAHRVESVEEVEYGQAIPVYDLSVDLYRNYAIDLGDNTGVFVHNTFSILYGKSPAAFGREFMKGDIPAARALFSDFFTAFPGVRDFIVEKHREALNTGYVSTLFGDPIRVDMPSHALTLDDDIKELIIENVFSRDVVFSADREDDRRMRMDIAKALRNAQNYPIQSTASSLAALCINMIVEKIKDHKLSAKVDCFTHDSSDIDLELHDLPYLLQILPEVAVRYPRSEYGIPVSIDYEIGVSGDHMVELHATTVNGNVIDSEFSCKESSFKMLTDRLDKSNIKYEYEVTLEEEDGISMQELFITRRAYSLDIGKTFKKISGKIKISF